MQRHLAGKSVRGAKVTELLEPDVRSIREVAHITKAANLVIVATAQGVSQANLNSILWTLFRSTVCLACHGS